MSSIHECNSGKNPAGKKWNRLLDSVVTIIKYNKITIYRAIYIKVFSDGTVSYIIVSTDDVLKNTYNDKVLPELRRFFEEAFEMKFQEGSVLKYLNYLIFQYPLGFSIYQIDHIMELVNEWLPTGKVIKVNTYFRKYSTYKN